ncbi:MAG: ABC transporter substrate-binding protein [Planctomycetota bacterium]
MSTAFALPCVWVAPLLALAVTPASAADDEPLHDSPPRDLIILNAANGGDRLSVLPLPRGRRVSYDPLPESGELRAFLADDPTTEFEVSFSAMERVVLFEDRLLEETRERVGRRDFDGAYRLLSRLDRDYPRHRGLREAYAKALRVEALALYQQERYDHALALLEALYERSRRARGVGEAVERIAEAILAARWERQDYAGVRATLDSLAQQFDGLQLTVRARWSPRVAQAAEELRAEARTLAAGGQARAAMRVALAAKRLSPGAAADRIVAELASSTRTLWVAVPSVAEANAAPRLDSPAALRSAWLVGGRLGALVGYGPTGGEYECEFGTLDAAVSRDRLTVTAPSSLVAASLARALLQQPSTAVAPLGLLGQRTASVALTRPRAVEITLRGPHPAPNALLRTSLPGPVNAVGRWRRVTVPDGSDAAARYERVAGGGWFDSIEEFLYDDPDTARDALRAGELHAVLDLPPTAIDAFAATPGLSVVGRRLPVVHALIPAPGSALATRKPARRALAYGIARETIVAEALGGADREGFVPLSGPFPRGRSVGDPLRYAYDDRLSQRPYEPRLAALLLASERQPSEGGAPPAAPLPERLRLGHTPTPQARLVAGLIADQLKAIGQAVDLVEAGEASLAAGSVDCDVRLATLAIGEPLVDAWPLLGPGGIAPADTPPARTLLAELLEATSGSDAANALRELHAVAHAELPLIPLWQTVPHFAVRADLVGVPENPVAAYQAIDEWRPGSGGGR